VQQEDLSATLQHSFREIDAGDLALASQCRGHAEGTGVRKQIQHTPATAPRTHSCSIVALIEKQPGAEAFGKLHPEALTMLRDRKHIGGGLTRERGARRELLSSLTPEVGT